MRPKKISRRRIEAAARAIRFLVPVDGCSSWTEYGKAVTKWPRDFSKAERRIIRLVAKAALSA